MCQVFTNGSLQTMFMFMSPGFVSPWHSYVGIETIDKGLIIYHLSLNNYSLLLTSVLIKDTCQKESSSFIHLFKNSWTVRFPYVKPCTKKKKKTHGHILKKNIFQSRQN